MSSMSSPSSAFLRFKPSAGQSWKAILGLSIASLLLAMATPLAAEEPPEPALSMDLLENSSLRLDRLEARFDEIKGGAVTEVEQVEFLGLLREAKRFFLQLGASQSELARLDEMRAELWVPHVRGKRKPGEASVTPTSESAAVNTRADGTGPAEAQTAGAEPVALQGSDACEDAPLVGLGTFLGSTVGSTMDNTSSCAPLGIAGDIWYKIQLSAGETLFASTAGSSFDTVLSIHEGCPVPDFNTNLELVCDDNSGPGQTSKLSWTPFADTEVWVRVSGDLADSGDYQLALESGGRLEGRVLSDSGEPMNDVLVEVFGDLGNFPFGFAARTRGDGRFEVDNLDEGDYQVVVRPQPPYLPESYDDIPCDPGGFCTDGQAIPVAFGETVELVDIRLSEGGAIEGRVRDRESGASIQDAFISVFPVEDSGFFEALVREDGTYRIEGLPTGLYVAQVDGPGDYQDQAYDDIACNIFCQLDQATPISVTAGETRSGVDFHLDRFGAISGEVKDEAGNPFIGLQVSAFTLEGSRVETGISGVDGSYTVGTLQTGTYYVVAGQDFFPTPWVPELYREVPCILSVAKDCDFTLGTRVDVEFGQTTPGIDFSLSGGATFSGRISAAESDAPIQDASVQVRDRLGTLVALSSSGADGTYLIEGLTGGDYFLTAFSQDGSRFTVLYPDVICVDGICDQDLVIPVSVAFEEERTGLDMALPPRGGLSGRVTVASTGAPAAGRLVQALSGPFGGLALTDSDGRYEIVGLSPGTYEVTVDGEPDFLTARRTVDIAFGETIVDFDFMLSQGGSIAGEISFREGGTVVGAFVEVFDESLTTVKFRDLEPGMVAPYRIQGLEVGRYYVKVNPGFNGGFSGIPMVWPGVICPDLQIDQCLDGAVQVQIQEEEQEITGIDFSLEKFSEVLGSVKSADTNFAVGGEVEMWSEDGELVDTAGISFDGFFGFSRPAPGRFYFIARPALGSGYMDEVFGGAPCLDRGCDPTSGQLVEIGFNGNVNPIFRVSKGGSLSGSWRERGGSSIPDGGLFVDIHDSSGRFLTTSELDGDNWFVTAVPDGDYFLIGRDVTREQYFDQVWPGTSCYDATCSISQGDSVSLDGGANLTDVDFALDRIEPVSGRVRRADNGAGVGSAIVRQWSAGGILLDQTIAEADGAFSLSFRESSYLSTSTTSLQDEVWPDAPCPDGDCRLALAGGQLIHPVPGQPTAGIDFSLEAGQECGSATELCTLDNRFRTTVRWQTDNAQGQGGAMPLTNESGYFWFFDPANVEVVIKTLDACDGFGHFWVFSAGLTNVEVEITVVDSVTGATKVYENPAGNLFEPTFDTSAFATCGMATPITAGDGDQAADGGGKERSAILTDLPFPELAATAPVKNCQESENVVCLNDGRFQVEGTFATADLAGAAKPIRLTSDTAYFWFFNPDNVEVVLKVLDACDGFDRFWVFATGLTNVEVDLKVTDTQNGAVWTYRNQQGADFEPVADTSTLLCP